MATLAPQRKLQARLQTMTKVAMFTSLLLSGCSSALPHNQTREQLQTAADFSHRSTAEQSRDAARHPFATLAFFELQPDDTVVEIWPGGGWYTQILAPLLKDKGQLIAAHWPEDSEVGFFRRVRAQFDRKFLSQPQRYGDIHISLLEPPQQLQLAAANSADKVLTFRNVHNWMRNHQEQAVFNAAFKALKPGGILGVVEHRAPDHFSRQQMVDSGYVSSVYVQQLARAAGFELLASSDINANPKDNKNHPAGVWTLPPTLRLGEQDKAHYLAIGESDRMTLKFRKPQH